MPRHLPWLTAPGSFFLGSAPPAPPSAWARALGFHDARNGIAVIAAPATPVTVVATTRKCRRPLSTPPSARSASLPPPPRPRPPPRPPPDRPAAPCRPPHPLDPLRSFTTSASSRRRPALTRCRSS